MPADNNRVRQDERGFYVTTERGEKIYGRIKEAKGEPLKVEDGVVVSAAELRVFVDEVPDGDRIDGAKKA